MKVNGWTQWQILWGTPLGLFGESGAHRRLETTFVLAILLHLAPFGFLWHKQASKAAVQMTTLQDVDFIEPELEKPAPPPVVVEKPKSALDFLKMALPVFRKPPAIESPRDIALPQKLNEPKIAEPERLMEKKRLQASAAPEIRLDAKSAQVPKIADIAKIPQAQRNQPRSIEPALNLEEVGRKAVAAPQAPAISLDRSSRDRAADVSAAPKIGGLARTQNQERLVDKTPTAYKPPPAAPLGYQRRDAGSLSLDQPREVTRAVPKPVVAPVVPKPSSSQDARIEISKEKVKIVGPLSARKVSQSFIPDYPGWAKARNIEADVAIRFTVSPAGSVRENCVVERTSGVPELDRLALEALRKWKFSPLPENGQDQWGVITFRFQLE